MEIFINEVSLEGQYFTEAEFAESVRIFLDIFFIVKDKVKDNKVYTEDSQLLVYYEAIKGSKLIKSLNA